MSDKWERASEVRRIRRMLRELSELGQQSSLTGSLEAGVKVAVRRYNGILDRLSDLGIEPPGFEELDSDETTFDEVAVEATSLAGYLREDEEGENGESGSSKGKDMSLVIGLAPFIDQNALVELLHSNLDSDEQLDPGLLISLAPFLPREEISRLVRHHMQKLAGRGKSEAPTAQAPATAPKPAASPSREPAPQSKNLAVRTAAPSAAAGPTDDVTARLEELTGLLRREGVSAEERADILAEIARVTEEHAGPERHIAAS